MVAVGDYSYLHNWTIKAAVVAAMKNFHSIEVVMIIYLQKMNNLYILTNCLNQIGCEIYRKI